MNLIGHFAARHGRTTNLFVVPNPIVAPEQPAVVLGKAR